MLVFGLGWGASWGCNMSRDDAVISYVDVKRSARGVAPAIALARARKPLRLCAIVIGAASLAACAQSSVVSQRSQALASRSVSAEPRKHTPYASRKGGETRIASQGVASFYSDEQETASGEKFNAHELTAAHPTLPFGTKLRVTDVKTGRSVTVRVNDRGPYVPGRIVDVSYSAAQSLGMIGKGVANVRLDVVQ
jgi:rare lipoprotein A